MKKLFVYLAFALFLTGCNKTEYITARYVFMPSGEDVKAVITDRENCKVEYEAGDKIEVNVHVYAAGFNSYTLGEARSGYSSYNCDLLYDGSEWRMEKDGSIISSLEVKGKEGDDVYIHHTLENTPGDDYSEWFVVSHTKHITLTSGEQSISLSFDKTEDPLSSL